MTPNQGICEVMSKKIRVAILFGGQSAEHEVSLRSAKTVVEALDKTKYEPLLIGIDHSGQWHLDDGTRLGLPPAECLTLAGTTQEVGLIPGQKTQHLVNLAQPQNSLNIDVVFPVLHGPMGEDGTVQGFLKLAHLPFVGCGVLGSAVGMDKDVMKRLLREAGIPVGNFLVCTRHNRQELAFARVQHILGTPIFIKPANLGSSVGVHRVEDEAQFIAALDDAFLYDRKVLIEEFIQGREIECAVLGNQDPLASIPGEIIPRHKFYSYDAKYTDEQGAILEIPAQLTPAIVIKVQQLALATFKVLCCEGLARVDIFLRGEDELLVNEINTLPGFTSISMYPKLWEISGLSNSELVDRLITLALERFTQEQQLKTSVQAKP